MFKTKTELYISDKILDENNILEKIKKLKNQGKTIGLCTGSFDLLHPAHLLHLISAKKVCDILIVAIARDKYNAETRKAKGRPIFNENVRAFMVSQLKAVDYVFFDDRIRDINKMIKPDIYIKGYDYSDGKNPSMQEQIEIVSSYGGKIHYTEGDDFTTTELIKYIKEQINGT